MRLPIILLAMLAAGAGGLHSWRARNLYVQASLYAEAFALMAQPKLRVGDRYVRTGRMPNDNESAGLPPPRRRIVASSASRRCSRRRAISDRPSSWRANRSRASSASPPA